jgi:sec-independent protein translocase protein TatA
VIGDILQPTHLLFILVIALLVLGPKRLPEVGRALGKGVRDFRNAMMFDDNERDAMNVRQHIADATAPLATPIMTPAPPAPPAPPMAPTPPTEPTQPQN